MAGIGPKCSAVALLLTVLAHSALWTHSLAVQTGAARLFRNHANEQSVLGPMNEEAAELRMRSSVALSAEASSSAMAVSTVGSQSQSVFAGGGNPRLYHMGFFDDYRCTGRIYDEPRRWRMKCAHNPKRMMPCKCASKKGSSALIHCDCESPVVDMSGENVPFQSLDNPELLNAAVLPVPAIPSTND
jgi:hypothetical protein